MLMVWVYLHSLIHNEVRKKLGEVVCDGRSELFRSLVLIGKDCMRINIVHYCDAMPIFYRFRDMTVLVENLHFLLFSHCSLV